MSIAEFTWSRSACERDLHLAHRGQRLQPGQRVVGGVGVHRGQRALVAGVHRLQHVQRLAAADLADDDPVRAHPQRVADQVADGHRAAALDVRRPGLQPDHVLLLQRQLGGVLDRDDPLPARDELRQRVQHGGLARRGAAGDDDVQPGPDAGGQQLGGRPVQACRAEQLGQPVRLGEQPDGHRRPGQRQRRQHHVHPGAARHPVHRPAAGRPPSGWTRPPAGSPRRRSGRWSAAAARRR